MRILIAEDFAPFRALVSSLLLENSDVQVIYEVSDGLEAVRRARELTPDLILLDIGLPGVNGMDAARQILGLMPTAKIVFLSQHNSRDVVQEALGLGGLGYVYKPRAGIDLFPAILAALRGKQFVSSGLGVTGPDPTDETHSP